MTDLRARYAREKAALQHRLRSFAWWVLANVQPGPTEVDVALKAAFLACGLNVDLYHRDFDVLATGKWHEVLAHAARALGQPLTTVADLQRVLEG